MTRANWKGPYLNEKNLKSFEKLTKNYEKVVISRDTEIMPKFIEQTFKVYNGRKYDEISVTENMVGHKFGEFASTRKRFTFKKKKSKK